MVGCAINFVCSQDRMQYLRQWWRQAVFKEATFPKCRYQESNVLHCELQPQVCEWHSKRNGKVSFWSQNSTVVSSGVDFCLSGCMWSKNFGNVRAL